MRYAPEIVTIGVLLAVAGVGLAATIGCLLMLRGQGRQNWVTPVLTAAASLVVTLGALALLSLPIIQSSATGSYQCLSDPLTEALSRTTAQSSHGEVECRSAGRARVVQSAVLMALGLTGALVMARHSRQTVGVVQKR
ncbi:MAG: hypothetical protein V9E81_09795 [Marmoricola sp.]|jgi:hypothetical protein